MLHIIGITCNTIQTMYIKLERVIKTRIMFEGLLPPGWGPSPQRIQLGAIPPGQLLEGSRMFRQTSVLLK